MTKKLKNKKNEKFQKYRKQTGSRESVLRKEKRVYGTNDFRKKMLLHLLYRK